MKIESAVHSARHALAAKIAAVSSFGLLIASPSAHAVFTNEGTLAGPCAWASAVRLDDHCSGTLITDDFILTAAHCATPDEAKFGENDLNDPETAEATVALMNCTRHYNFIHVASGPDLMICEINTMIDAAPNVPKIPIMVPTGPARDWLRHEIYGYQYKWSGPTPGPTPEVIAVGAGCNNGSCTFSGNKLQAPAWLEKQFANNGVPTRLDSRDGLDDELNPLEFVDTRNGDSGGPLFVQMRDDSWRQIGVLHGGVPGSYNEHEAAPPICRGSNKRSLVATTTLPRRATILGTLDGIYLTALAKAENGDFGTPPTQAAIEQYFLDEIAETDDALFPFLGSGYGAGNFGLFVMTTIQGDFNGNSEMDTVHAYPYTECGKGTLFQQLDDETTSEWNRDTTGILGTGACGDYFGAAVAVGDFDGDGYDDLAVSAPGSTAGTINQAGSISVLYGSSSGLSDSGDQIFDQDSSGIGDNAEEHDFAGEALASGDFNCDGYDDLAIGVPREDEEITTSIFDAGLVIVLYGSSGGLTTTGSATFFQGIGGVDGSSEPGDQFAAALVSANFNGDVSNSIECDDLAVGVPFEDVGTTENGGRIYILHGGATGLTTNNDQSLSQDSTGVEDAAGANDIFGANLVAEEDGTLDGLTVQVPGETCTTGDSVGQHRFYGMTGGGLSTSTDAISCEEIDSEFNSYHWGMREHAVTYYTIRLLEEL